MDSQETLAQLARMTTQVSEDRFKEDSRERLRRIAAKKFRTCFIFPIAEFEKVFGLELWGHGLPEESLTPGQRANRERWEQVRTAILNNGNIQSRALQAELDLHSVKYTGYRVELRGGEKHGS